MEAKVNLHEKSFSPANRGEAPLWLFYLAVGLVSLWFFSQHNRFPIYYHPDESSKGAQIVSGVLNFHHPLLLLDSIKIVLGIRQQSPTLESAVFAGRWVSAIFSAGSVVALTILARRRGGLWAAVLAAILIPLHPLIYELAHYCKEDPALLLGMSLTLLFLDVFLTRTTIANALLLGGAAGLAVSGKYLGVVMLLTTFPLVCWNLRHDKRLLITRMTAYLAGFFVVVLLINLPYFLQPSALQKGLGYEIQAASLGGNKGLSRDVPHGKYIGIFLDNIAWPLWIGIIAFAGQTFATKQNRKAVNFFLLIFPLAYTLLLSFSPKTASRYFLAVAPFLILSGSLGLIYLAHWAKARRRPLQWAVLGVISLVAIYSQVELTKPSIQGMQTDSRREMATWMQDHLPPEASIAAESRIHLLKPESWKNNSLPTFAITEESFLPDIGSFDDLASKKIRYFAVIRTSFGGYLDEKRKPAKSLEDQHQRRSQFYEELFAKGVLLKRTGGNGVGILNPEIRLYELLAAPAKTN